MEKRLPNIGEYVRGVGTLVSIEDYTPPPPPLIKHYIFEEITARCEVRLNGETLNKFNSVWDFYGKAWSVEDAIKTAREYAKRQKLGPKSDIEVVAIKEIHQVKKQPRMDVNSYDPQFINFERIYDSSLPGPVEEVVWSSKAQPSEETGKSEK